MREYFESEMRLLHEAAVDFAKAHPEQARMLNLAEVRDRDPYVERLLEGMAFIAAQIRGRIDDSEMAISEQLLEQLCPGQLRGYPSGTIMSFMPEPHAQIGKTVPRGSQVTSPAVGDQRQRCHFTTLAETQVQPLVVSAVQAREQVSGGAQLTVTLKHSGGGLLSDLDWDYLDFYLHADQALALALLQGLTEKPAPVHCHHGDNSAPFASLPASSLSAPYLAPLYDSEQQHHRGQPGFDLLQDYFSWRERFLFVRLSGLGAISIPANCDSLRLVFSLPITLPTEHQLRPEHLRLNCVPAVNLYEIDADPLEVDQRQAEYRFLPDRSAPDTVVLHQLLSLTGREHHSARIYHYRPFYQSRAREEGEHCYRLSHRDLGLATPQPFLSLSGPSLVEPQTLSARVRVSDGYLPRRYLSENQITQGSKSLPNDLRITNVIRPTRYLPCPTNSHYRWQLQAMLQLATTGLATQASLETLMGLLDWSEREENRRRRQSIQEVGVEPVTRMIRGMLYRGLAVTVHLNQGDFLSLSDIYLFGCVLHQLLRLAAPLNETVELKVIAQPSHKEFVWDPLAGCTAPI